MKKINMLLFLALPLFADEIICNFQNSSYVEICEKLIKNGVAFNYTNEFLTSQKAQTIDELSYKLLQPNQIQTLSENEKKANQKLSDEFIPKIVAHLREHKHIYDEAERRYGVNREIVASILMKETKLGKIKLSHDAFVVFNTIILKTDPQTQREEWLVNMAKSNMISMIEHCYKKNLSPQECNMPSSYAGAIGIPQFMPESFPLTQGYETELADLSKMPDAIMSASKFLHKRSGFLEPINWNKIPNIVDLELKWYEFEFENKNASLVYEQNQKSKKRYNCFTCRDMELDYFREYAKKIMRYNNSSNYAMGVMRLAFDAQKKLKEESLVSIKAFETQGLQ